MEDLSFLGLVSTDSKEGKSERVGADGGSWEIAG